MKNIALRTLMLSLRVKQWQLAEELGISEYSLSRRLRHELPPDQMQEALAAVERIANEREGLKHGEEAI